MKPKTNIAQRRLDGEAIEHNVDKYECCGCSIDAEAVDNARVTCAACLNGTCECAACLGNCLAEATCCCAACAYLTTVELGKCCCIFTFRAALGLYKLAECLLCCPCLCPDCLLH